MENEVLDYVMNTPGNTNPAILEQMLDANSGTKLPEPTLEDNGKVLGVSEGQYALVSGGGGGGSAEPLIVNSSETGIDATYNELKAALVAGKTIYLLMVNGDDVFYSQLANISIEGGAYYAAFYKVYNFVAYTANDADTDMGPLNVDG